MHIRMLRKANGSPHGHDGFIYEAGEFYTPETDPPMTEALARIFLREGWATEVTYKAMGAAPENKMLDASRDTQTKGREPVGRRRGR